MSQSETYEHQSFHKIELQAIENLTKKELLEAVEQAVQAVIQEKLDWSMSHHAAKSPESEKAEIRKKLLIKYWLILIVHFVYQLSNKEIAKMLFEEGLTNKKTSHQNIQRMLCNLKNRITSTSRLNILKRFKVPVGSPVNITDEMIQELVAKYLELQVEKLLD